LQFISISAHNLINANTQDKAIFEWCIANTESCLNYKFEDLEVYYSNTDKEYREILIENKLSKDMANRLVRTSYACGIWNTNKIFLNKSGLSINKQKEILCHELVHKWQQSKYDKEYVIMNRSKIESEAEKSASKIAK
jgi:Zn-dependent peptidase ImmA (M78 family)